MNIIAYLIIAGAALRIGWHLGERILFYVSAAEAKLSSR